MNRRQFLAAQAAGAALLQQGVKAFAAPAGTIQVAIDASKPGAPITPMIFGGYLEPATTRVWAEMLTDRKFANAVTSAAEAPQPAGNSPMRRFAGEPFRPVGPAGAVEMDNARPFVGKHSPRVKLDGSGASRNSAVAAARGAREVVCGAGLPGRRPGRESGGAAGVGTRRERLADGRDPALSRTNTRSSR